MKKLIYTYILFVTLIILYSGNIYAEVAVIVNPANSAEISKSDIKKIYLGKKKKFPDGKSAIPIALSPDEASSAVFNKKVVGKSSKQFKSFWAKNVFTGKGKPPNEVSSSEMLELIANNPNMIGYINASDATAAVKVVGKF